LRYDTGIGPMRFDFGFPTGGATGNGGQLYIGIGQAF
jgi:translocation and assembly module TamA